MKVIWQSLARMKVCLMQEVVHKIFVLVLLAHHRFPAIHLPRSKFSIVFHIDSSWLKHQSNCWFNNIFEISYNARAVYNFCDHWSSPQTISFDIVFKVLNCILIYCRQSSADKWLHFDLLIDFPDLRILIGHSL